MSFTRFRLRGSRLQLHELECRATPATAAAIGGFTSLTGPEGTPIALSSVVEGGTADTYQWSVTKDGAMTPYDTATTPDFTFTPDDDGSYVVTLTVTDTDGVTTPADSETFTIENVAPTASISGPTVGVPGMPLTFTVRATDPSPVDAEAGFNFKIDWNNDGVVDEVIPAVSNGFSFVVTHTYTTTGSNTISVTATDKDDGVSPAATQTVEIRTAALIDDPLNPGRRLLAVGGTLGDDTIHLIPAGNTGKIKVSVNGNKVGTFGPARRIAVFGQAGDDNIQLAGSIRIAAWLDGGEGNDRLKSAKGNDVLRGGPGDDDLNGHQGRDVLIGGEGADHMLGGPGDDLLIGGTTSFDSDEESLFEISTIWSGAGTVASRVAALQTSATVALVMDGSTPSVFDDGDADVMNGTAGAAWIFGDPTQDSVGGNKKGQFVNDVSVVASQGNGKGKGKGNGNGKP